MNILQLCNKVPYPPKDGGCIAMNNLTQGLIDEGHTVKVLSVNTKKHFIDIENLPLQYRSKTNIEAVFIDTEIKATEAFLNLFTDKSYNIQRFYSANFEKKLVEILRSATFDIVQLEGLYVSMYVDVIRKHSKAKIVLRAHNVEYKLWEDATQLAKNPLKKAYLKLLTKRLKQYELNFLSTVDAIATITKKDEIHFKRAGFLKAIETVPFGIDLKNTIENNSTQEEYPSVFHIGAMDWQPNIEGLDWFLNNVWDKLNAKHPHLKLYLAGRNMSSVLKQSNKTNVIIIGEVENAQEFIESKGVMIVPLLSGSGMRIKIIEGLALGKTIVTTSIGAEGIDCENNKNCMIADDANKFADAISKCVSEKIFYDEIGKNAKILALQQYNNADICKRLIKFYQKILTDNE
ncbi:MAG: glycosyltransferase family 4 protein [Bacteroidota bacterium]